MPSFWSLVDTLGDVRELKSLPAENGRLSGPPPPLQGLARVPAGGLISVHFRHCRAPVGSDPQRAALGDFVRIAAMPEAWAGALVSPVLHPARRGITHSTMPRTG